MRVSSALQALTSGGATARVWRQALACAGSLLRAAPSELLQEAVSEAIKNMLLVLAASQSLDEEAWAETWAALDAQSVTLRAEMQVSLQQLHATPRQPSPVVSAPPGVSAPLTPVGPVGAVVSVGAIAIATQSQAADAAAGDGPAGDAQTEQQ